MSKGKPIDIKDPEHFYARKRPKNQKGLHRLLCERRSIAPEMVVECLEEYRTTNQTNPHEPWSKEFTLDVISHENNFSKFLEIVSRKTGCKFKKNPYSKEGYDEWWQRKNMDGSFAYSGVTEDF